MPEAKESSAQHVFVARQPIFTRQQKVDAYELLFRSGFHNAFDAEDGDHASAQVIANTFLSFGIETMTGGKTAFINFTRNLLLEELALILPHEQVVIEILEDVEPDAEVLHACKKLKQRGYTLALDDFVMSEKTLTFIPFVDLVKIDFQAHGTRERQAICERLSSEGVTLVAEKVETNEEVEEGIELGCTYFQGYFFSKPSILSRKEIPASKLTYLQILQAVYEPEIDFGELEQIVKTDVALSYKFLRYLNSAAYAFVGEIKSIRHALTLLGRDNARRLIALVAVSALVQDKPEELIVTALTRANFCEVLARAARMEQRRFDLYLMGMFSVIDAILDQPMEEAVSLLPLAEDIRRALVGEKNPFRDILEIVQAYEKGVNSTYTP
jgi:EAL and modified HD-GYP domain-containing signal transduction protein